MTECERIVKEGIVPEDFLKEETRCDSLSTRPEKDLGDSAGFIKSI